jgi:branched-chain amino acid transport system permease protein
VPGLPARTDESMRDVLLYSLLGLGIGGVIAGLAIAIVLVYRGSGVINLATGAFAMVGAYLYWGFFTRDDLGFHPPLWLAFALTLISMAIFGALVELIAFWPLRNASPLARLAASLGVLLVAQAVIGVGVTSQQVSAPDVLPQGAVAVFGGAVPYSRLMLAGIAIGVGIVLIALYRWTLFGLATRAASENEVSAMLSGLAPSRLSMANTVLAAMTAGAFGVLAGSLVQLDSVSLPNLVVPALAAALFARFTSFGVACVAGLAIGIGYSLVNYASALSWFPKNRGAPMAGLPELLFFLAVCVAMFLRGSTLPGRGEIVEKRLPMVPRPEHLLRPAVIAAVAGVVALIVFPYDFRQALINSMIGILICLSLVVIVGFVGQMSIVQLALAGAAGFTMSHLATDVGGVWAEFPIAALAGAGCAMVLGMLTAVAALRVRGVALVVVTMAGALAIQTFGFGNSTWGYDSYGTPIKSLSIGGLDLSSNASFRGIDGNLPSPIFGFVVLAFTILCCLLVSNLRRSSLGQRMLAVRSNERAAAAAGIDVRLVKLAAFAFGSFIAGLAGTMYGYNFGSASPTRFDVVGALALIAFTYFGGITMVSGAIVAGIGATEGLLPHAFDRFFGLSGTYALLVGGVALIVTLIANPDGIAGTGYRRKMLKNKRRGAEGGAPPSAGAFVTRLRRAASTSTVASR